MCTMSALGLRLVLDHVGACDSRAQRPRGRWEFTDPMDAMATTESVNPPPFDWGESVRIIDDALAARSGYSIASVCGGTGVLL